MVEHIRSTLPEEACGLIGGQMGEARLIVPVTNELHSAVRFRMSPQEQLQAFLHFETEGMDLIGIYHSHPNGPAIPSRADVIEFAYPDVETLIWMPRKSSWKVRAFIIGNSTVSERLLVVMPGQSTIT